jgi:hypothetical protein
MSDELVELLQRAFEVLLSHIDRGQGHTEVTIPGLNSHQTHEHNRGLPVSSLQVKGVTLAGNEIQFT